MNKNNVNLLVYSLTLESGIKNIGLNLYYFYSVYFILFSQKNKKNMCMRKNQFIFIYLFTGARVGNKKY